MSEAIVYVVEMGFKDQDGMVDEPIATDLEFTLDELTELRDLVLEHGSPELQSSLLKDMLQAIMLAGAVG
jgi:hypothetical protein